MTKRPLYRAAATLAAAAGVGFGIPGVFGLFGIGRTALLLNRRAGDRGPATDDPPAVSG
jgi:hypothetical protein